MGKLKEVICRNNNCSQKRLGAHAIKLRFFIVLFVRTKLCDKLSYLYLKLQLIFCVFIESPVITKGPEGFQRSKPGETVVFKCDFQGDPEPTVSWSKDGSAVKDGGRISITIEKGHTELKIEKLQYSDAATYQIALANTFGNAWAEAILDMNGKSLKFKIISSLFQNACIINVDIKIGP